MKTEILEDGTLRSVHRPHAGIPFYGDWLDFLVKVGAAHTTMEVDKRTGSPTRGQHVERATPLNRYQEQRSIIDDDGSVKILCIGCGEPASMLDMSRIRVGGFVQMPIEEQIDPKEVHVKWRTQPIARMGLGCKLCQHNYTREVEAANIENKQIEDANAEILALPAAKRKLFKMQKERTPFIDVLAHTGDEDETRDHA